MHKVFVNTNALLGIYVYSSDDLTQLKKLADEIQSARISLFLTDQVMFEFERNRAVKLKETLKQFEGSKEVSAFPDIVKQHPSFASLNAAAEEFRTKKALVTQQVKRDIFERKLPADLVLEEIKHHTEISPATQLDLEAAELRMKRGNPPGKPGSFGDAINWEMLLRMCARPTDLHFVTQDSDFLSPLDSDKETFNEFLEREWSTQNGGKVYVFKTLRSLFHQIAPRITLSVATTSVAANSAMIPSMIYDGPSEHDWEDQSYVMSTTVSGPMPD